MEKLNFNTLVRDLEKVRSAIATLKEDRHWLETAPASKEDLIKKTNAMIDGMSAESRVIGKLFSDSDPFKATVRTGSEHHQEADLGPVLCDLFGDAIKDSIKKKIDALDYEAGPPLADRPQLLADNAVQIKEMEIAEETLICEGEKIGIAVPRRRDIDPAVFLETHLDWPAPPAAPPPAHVAEQHRIGKLARVATTNFNIRS